MATHRTRYHGTRPPESVTLSLDQDACFLTQPQLQFGSAVYPTSNQITPYPEASSVIIGDEYYRASRFMPRGRDSAYPLIRGGLKENSQGTHMTWGLNFGYNNVTNAANIAQSIFRTFSPTRGTTEGGVILDFIEFGTPPVTFVLTILTRGLCGRQRA